MGAIGGFIKSCLSHKGKIKLPSYVDDYFVLGSLLDIIGGGFFGLIVANELIYNIFGLSASNWAFSGIMGFTWITVAEVLVNKFLPQTTTPNQGYIQKKESLSAKPSHKTGCAILPIFFVR